MASLLWSLPMDLQPTQTTKVYFETTAISNRAAVLDEASDDESYQIQHRCVAVTRVFFYKNNNEQWNVIVSSNARELECVH